MKKTIISLGFCCWCIFAFAQYGFELDQKSYAAAKVSMFLLKNENGKIPISNTDAQDVQHVYHGDLKNLCHNLDLYYTMPQQVFSSNQMKKEAPGFLVYSFVLDERQLG